MVETDHHDNIVGNLYVIYTNKVVGKFMEYDTAAAIVYNILNGLKCTTVPKLEWGIHTVLSVIVIIGIL